MQTKRVFLIVLDSVGIGAEPDAHLFGDEGSNTLAAVREHINFNCPNMASLGLFNIDGVGGGVIAPRAAHARLQESSMGKDTTIGHWEIAGVISEKPMPTYPDGLPKDMIERFEALAGVKTLCHKPYSGTEVIKDFGKEHLETGALIVYTSADSVFQIAAHEDIVPIEKLYEYCEIAREMLQGDWGVGRVIARPFEGEYPFKRTSRRHDYSLTPPKPTMLDLLKKNGFETISIGKIYDIFAGQGISEGSRTSSNDDGMQKTMQMLDRDFNGLCFVNLVDFDMLYGHRQDIDGYAAALTAFDAWLPQFIDGMAEDDVLMITADHGCDPGDDSTDHTREEVPFIIYGKGIEAVNLGTRLGFATIGNTAAELLGVSFKAGKAESVAAEVTK